MIRFPGFSASNFDHPGVCATIRFLDRRIWDINHGNRDQDPAHAAWQVDGKSISAIAKIIGLFRHTVRKYLRQPPSGISWVFLYP